MSIAFGSSFPPPSLSLEASGPSNSTVTSSMTVVSSPSTWKRATADLSATFVWGYDTVAILDPEDYYDFEHGVLPAGQLLRFSADAQEPGFVLCDLDDPRTVERRALPAGRVLRQLPWCFATRLQAVVAASDYQRLTTDAERPSRLRRLARYFLSPFAA